MTTSESRPTRGQLVELCRRAVARMDLEARTRARFTGMVPPSAVLAVGKCAGAMLDGARLALPPGWGGPLVAILPDGAPAPRHADGVAVLRASHPFPDGRVRDAADTALDLASASSERRPLWLCLSGGGSACLGAPQPPLTTHDLRNATRALMLKGASIGELNTVRKHLCRVLGGRLGASARGLVAAVAVDVVDEDLGMVASGPAWPDRSTPQDALAILQHYGALDQDGAVEDLLRAHRPIPSCPPWPHVAVATPSQLRELLAQEVRAAGWNVHVVDPPLRSPQDLEERLLAPARAAGGVWVDVSELSFPVPTDAPPGGRCAHLALEVAARMRGQGRFSFAGLGSDGRDGPTENCGAAVDETTLDGQDTAVTALALEHGNAHAVLRAAAALLPRCSSTINLLDMHVLWTAGPVAAAGGAG